MRLSQDLIIKYLIGLTGILYLFNLRLEFYIDDPGLFATIAAQIAETGEWLSLYVEGRDWLDKPHLPFWIIACFFKAFGVNSLAYLLPHTICIFLACYYCFLFARRHYDVGTAWLSVLILISAQHTLMAGAEGRVEPFLMFFIIAAVYHFDRFTESRKTIHLLCVSLFTACAIMSKGIFLLAPIFGAIFGHLWYKTKSVKFIFKPHWIAIFALIGIFLIPEIYSLWVQFDSQPDKIVFGRKNVSGIKWFFWDSQFTRLINEGPITRAKGDFSYFFHTQLWAFFPWALALYFAIYQIAKNIFTKVRMVELYSFCGAMAMFVLFSISKFQLPHYITIIFPFYAIIVANAFVSVLGDRSLKFLKSVQWLQVILGSLLILFSFYFWNTSMYSYLLIVVALAIGLCFLFLFIKDELFKTIYMSVVIVLLINTILSVNIYPTIAEYRGDNKAIQYVNENYPNQELVILGPSSNRVLFYTNGELTRYWSPSEREFENLIAKDLILSRNEEYVNRVLVSHEEIARFDHYVGESFSLGFLNPRTRADNLVSYVLLKRGLDDSGTSFSGGSG